MAAACCRTAMACGPTADRFQSKYTVKTRAPTGSAATGPGGGTGGGGGTGTHAAMASSEPRMIARFIGFLLWLSTTEYKKPRVYATSKRVFVVRCMRLGAPRRENGALEDHRI